jgi:hypothetical protein
VVADILARCFDLNDNQLTNDCFDKNSIIDAEARCRMQRSARHNIGLVSFNENHKIQ